MRRVIFASRASLGNAVDEWPSDSSLDVVVLLGALLGTVIFAWKDRWGRGWQRESRTGRGNSPERHGK